MRTPLVLVGCVFLACGGVPGPSDAGQDAGADAGPQSCFDPRPACAWPGHWNISARPASDFDAGGFSPCLPLPSPAWHVFISSDGAAWCSETRLAWAEDAGCRLRLDDSFTSSNPSETYRHEYALVLGPADAGVRGDGTYTLTGGSNCVVPLEASGVRMP